MNKILVIRLKGLGDIINLLPSLKILRNNFKESNITLLCQKPFGEIIPPELNIKTIQISPNAGIYTMLQLIKNIRKQRYDILFDLYCNSRTAIISLLSNIKKRIGFNYRIRKYAYTDIYTPKDPNKFLANLFADFFAEFGINGQLERIKPYFSKQDLDNVKRNLKNKLYSGGLILGINPFTTYPSKRWPWEYYIEIVKKWYLCLGEPAIIFYGPSEYSEAEYLHKLLPNSTILPEINSLREYVALVSLCNLFITADTGPMHIAASLDVPTVAIFGPTTRRAVAPTSEKHLIVYNEKLECLECHKEICDHNKCMKELTPQILWNKIWSKYKISDFIVTSSLVSFQKKYAEFVKFVTIDPCNIDPDKIIKISNEKYHNKAIFLDRDGTINPDYGYISDPSYFDLYSDVGINLKKLKNAGYLLILITNQSGIHRNLIKLENIIEIHKKMHRILLDNHGFTFDGIYVCPHHPTISASKGLNLCLCRKPALGMIYQAVCDYKINLKKSVIIGDKYSDIKIGHVLNIKSILLERQENNDNHNIIYDNDNDNEYCICSSFEEVVKAILIEN